MTDLDDTTARRQGLQGPTGMINIASTSLILCNSQEAEATALYFDATYDVTDRFHLTGGIRYTDEQKPWAGRPRVNVFLLDGGPSLEQLGGSINGADFNKYAFGVVRNSKSWQEPTYRLIAGYDCSNDLFGFFGYSRGFKSGGYNDQLGTQLNLILIWPPSPLTRAPELVGSVDGTYVHTIGSGHRLEWKLRASYEDESVAAYSDVAPEYNTMLNEKMLVDASVTFYDKDDRYFNRALGSNLIDEDYRAGSLSVATLWIMSAYGPPSYFGLEFGAKFDF